MKKWGVRLIGIWFLLLAISSSISLAKGVTRGLINYKIGDFNLDVITLVMTCLYIYIGFQLIRINSSGRTWALILLWWGVLSSAWVFVSFISAIKENRIFDTRFGQIDAFTYAILLGAGILVMFSVPLYYLERKDIKELFESPTPPDVPQTISELKV